MSFSVAAVALGSYSAAWEYISSNVSAIFNLNGSKDVDGITIIKSDYTKKYDTIEELLVAEKLDILYPAALPKGVKIERVKVENYNNEQYKISYIFNSSSTSFYIKNLSSIDLSKLENIQEKQFNGYNFYIINIDNISYQAILQIENFEYIVNSADYNQLTYILSNIKGVKK